jgi:P pilus assembly chaperone PapD
MPLALTRLLLPLLLVLGSTLAARADIALDRAILDLEGTPRADVEVQNVGDETRYVVVEPEAVADPGTDGERRWRAADPEELGLLVTPTRLVLEPGARRVVRFVRLGGAPEHDRIWRVAIRPVVGATASETNALDVLVGYGVLVMARPDDAASEIVAERRGRRLVLENRGNSNALLFGGAQCNATGAACRELPVKRLYPGNRWELRLPYDTPVSWQVRGPEGVAERRF